MLTGIRHGFSSPRVLRYLVALLTLVPWLVAAAPAAAEPLEVDGKPGLYQRVLSRPGAAVTTAPAPGEEGTEVPPFTAFYVFARETVDGTDWVEVGPGRVAEPTGWLSADQTIPWNHTMVLAFGNPVGRLPVLFFDDRESLLDLVLDEKLPVIAPELADEARAGSVPPDSGVISIEPEEWVDFTESFYLLPILEAEQTFLASGVRAKIVEIASIPLEEPAEEEAPAEESSEDYRVGVMFVVDTTTSMQPYIDRTRDTVRRIFDKLSGSPVGDRISFGMVAYRDTLEAVPDLEYLTEVVAPLAIPPDHEAFLEALDGVEVSTVSSAGFDEDGLAGMVTAINQDEWKNFGGRYIIFLSDAGVRDSDDPYSSTGMTPAAVNGEAREKRIQVVALLLATPSGSAYHEHAEAQYRALSAWEGMSRPAFYVVPEGNLDQFGPTIDEVVDAMVEQIQGGGSTADDEGDSEAVTVDCSAESEGAAGLSEAIRCAGYAMRLAWLGRERGTTAPSVFMGWAPDFALDDPRRKAFDVRVLLTKEQLSNLASALEAVLEAGQTVDTDPSLFFDQLRTVVLRAAVDPSTVDPDSIDSLGDLLDPVLADLPYESQLMEMNEDSWLDAGPARQAEILATVRSKVRAYQYMHDDADRWISLHEDAPADELVYPIPLDMLP